MAVPFDPTDPSSLTPEQRLDELAAILATGVRRVLVLRAGPADMPASGESNSSARIQLALSPETSVTVPRG